MALQLLTFNNKPWRRFQIVHTEHKCACVVQGQVGDSEAVNVAFSTHPPVVIGLELEAVLMPGAHHVGVGQLHLQGRSLTLRRLDVT